MVYYHNLDALLYFLVTEKWLRGDTIPPQLIKKWEKACFNNLILNGEIISLLRRLLEECRRKDIPIIVLKGPAALAQVYHENTGVRAMADLDLLCRKKDLKALSDMAFSLGCRRRGFIRLHHLIIAHETLGIYLELHFNLYHFMKNKKDFLRFVWKKTGRAGLEGVEFPVMPLEAQLALEVGHFLEHRAFVSLKHYLDFAAKLFLLKEEIDGKQLEQLLRLTGLRQEFISFSAALPELLGLPPGLFFSFADPPPGNLDVQIRKRLKLSASIGFGNSKMAGAELVRQTGLIKKIIFVFKRLFPPLAAIQAAYGLPSRRKAFLWIPRHLQETLRDFQERKRTEAMERARDSARTLSQPGQQK